MNVFIDSPRKDRYSIKPVINGPSDHDAQLIVINNIKPVANNCSCRKQTRIINDLTMNRFATHLRNENWGCVYKSHGLDLKF
jgi:hypothetical protein